jgi:hypothetical protein
MKKNSLAAKGLSLSQAQSISNMCFQRAQEIDRSLNSVNNISKSITLDGNMLPIVEGNPLPAHDQVVRLLTDKAKLHAAQAFLMENINAKTALLTEIRVAECNFDIPMPKRDHSMELTVFETVDENFGWEQLTASELNEFYEAEAFAAHIHQFINKNGKLTSLRNELPNIQKLEWFEVETGKKSPVIVNVHHDANDLLVLHEELAELHRTYEQRVNYFKAKVKNLVTAENARIAKLNADAVTEYNKAKAVRDSAYEKEYNAWAAQGAQAMNDYEIKRQELITAISKYRIAIDPRFQEVIDLFMKPDTEE